jgi:RNA-splicing ligase RtcB
MGTQGDGNHFAYLGELVVDDLLIEGLKSAGSNTGNLVKGRSYKVLVTHHGSRGLGAKVYKRGSKVAETLTNKVAANIPKACHWIPFDTKEGRDYWDALQYIRNWTRQNHDEIHRRVVSRLGVEELVFWNEHNFVWKRGNSFYHGKGATPSWSMGNYQSLGLIPLNMTEPILITTSTNNDKYLSFAPHGAGRNRSRTATLAPFKNDDGSFDEGALAAAIEADTESIDVRWYSGKPDLSECPRGYKNASEVIKQIEEFNLAKIVGRIYPIGCVMAGEQPPQPWQITKS